ncbi:MAG TPA: energy transducer TonB [Terracidiphilus sp.]|nr:energy transducer TonB [Terracidiphilus sp.]
MKANCGDSDKEGVETMGVRIGTKRVAGWIARGMALVLLAGMAVPGRAADERAVKSRVAPVYPEVAKRMKIGGVVKLEVTVDADGKVVDVKPVSGNQMLSGAAQEAVKKWKFAAGDGQSTVQIAVNFDIQ